MNSAANPITGIVAAVALLLSAPLPAAHPLITEDTDTLGRGNSQLELTTEHIAVRSGELEQYSVLSTAVLGYGLSDRTDVLFTAPHLRIGEDAALGTPGTHGFTDLGIDIKWRFYESGPLGFAFKPGLTVPTGDEQGGLGVGRTTWTLYLVSSYKIEDWTFLLHLGHVHHNNTFNERVNLWHASAAVTWQATDRMQLILDAGVDRNAEHHANDDPVFVIGGLIFSPRDDLDLDLGYRSTAVDSEREHALLAGLTVRW